MESGTVRRPMVSRRWPCTGTICRQRWCQPATLPPLWPGKQC